jgi:plastocyanin
LENDDTTLYTVTETEKGESATIFDSSRLVEGKTYEWKFDNAGTFVCFCTIHPFMKAKIIVM